MMRPLLGAVAAALIAMSAGAATFTVTNTNATGPGSLQDAINQANLDSINDTIAFNIPGAGVHLITQHGFVITTPMIIDATTQPGYAGAPLIEIDGGGLTIFSVQAPVTIRGFSLTHFSNAIDVGNDPGNTTVAANYIGVDADGATPNGGLIGVAVNDYGGTNTHIIGGATASDRNIISGNTTGVTANVTTSIVSVQGDFIGTQADGVTAVPNGVGVRSSSSGAATLVGGVAQNTIAHNTTSGVTVTNGDAKILSNSFFANGIGIDNVPPGNASTAPPALTSATTTGVSSTITGTLAVPTAASTPFLLQFFSNPVNENQGRTFVGQTNVTTDGSGNASFSASFGPLTPGVFVTATATNNTFSETSEFATNIPATAITADLTITKTTSSGSSVNIGHFIDYTITVSNAGPNSATGVTVTDTIPSQTSFVSATPSQGTCSGTSTVSCSVGTLANGASATIALRVLAASAGTATNSASVTENEIDPNGGLSASAPPVAIIAAVPTLTPLLLVALAAMLAAIALMRQ